MSIDLQACIRDEYGQTYPRKEVYDQSALSAQIENRQLVAMLAVSQDGDPVSSLVLSPCGGLADVPELTMHVVRKQYRGFGVGTSLTKAMLGLPISKNYSAVTTHSVTFHTMAQHQTLNCGLIPSGFLFLVHSNLILQHSFDTKGCIKQSFAVGVYPERKTNAGVIYAPDEHKDYIKKLYSRLNACFSFSEGLQNVGESQIHTNYDDIHNTFTAEIFRGGDDIEAWARELLDKPHHPHQTVNLLLDLNDPGAACTYETLAKKGFIFTGMHPLCGNGEFMLLHHSMDLEVQFDKLCIDDGYKEIFEYIKDFAGGKP